MRHALKILAVMALAVPGIASANELIIGLAGSDYSRNGTDDRVFGSLEYKARSFATRWGLDFSLGAAGLWDNGDDFFLGAGLIVRRDFGGERWFLEFSEMPGYYHHGDSDRDLGNDLEFRSQLAIGYRVTPDWAGSLAIAHMSNADTGDDNPGVNFLSLRLHRSF
ncbi:Lipid A 3-O-deacylase (PagL) [Paracoccus halophilus]|uniref:Lipid A 3-O-deacylase (PagL) n=1 Tax=Paracoccus halophilus TaxID=376733 RepID=A0A1I0TB01_9RHOB|nr:acyloxyacyl hydrolase [Paracoccus halophilus]SFA48897.1 Lipid A 3-O-deacylase (PagL) [Paracoccus halophilus]